MMLLIAVDGHLRNSRATREKRLGCACVECGQSNHRTGTGTYGNDLYRVLP